MSVRHELLEEIKIQFDKMGKAAIRLIGHSLGGGLATIMALDLKLNALQGCRGLLK